MFYNLLLSCAGINVSNYQSTMGIFNYEASPTKREKKLITDSKSDKSNEVKIGLRVFSQELLAVK